MEAAPIFVALAIAVALGLALGTVNADDIKGFVSKVKDFFNGFSK